MSTYRIAILSIHSGTISRGVETWVDEVSKRLTKNGNEVKIMSGKISWSELIKFKPDIVIPCNGGMQSLIVKLLSFVCRWKIVITGHAGLGRDDKWNVLTRPNVFVSPSRRGLDWAKNLTFSTGVEMVYIPHGVDLDKFNPKVKKIKLDLPRPIFLCVASNDAYKRVGLAKGAVDKLGKGSLLVLGGEKKVSPKDMPSYYASVDVFTLPSDEFEAFGIVYLEAMACGLPVVATNDSLRREIVGNAGVLVDPTKVDKYAKALNETARKDWGQVPRKQAEKFSWEEVVRQYQDLFNKLIK